MTLELSWVERDLRALDRLSGDVVVGSLFDDERPPRGVAGLIDWRLGGSFSRLCMRSFLTGAKGELFLAPGRPRVPFERVLIVGVGARASFDVDVFRIAMSRTLSALSDLQVRRATIDLPGRHAAAIDASVAFDALRALLAERSYDFESLTLLDDGDAQRAFHAATAKGQRVRR